jgi:hypothetical protein
MYYYIRRVSKLITKKENVFFIQEFKSYTKSNINPDKWLMDDPVRMIRPKVIYINFDKNITSGFQTVIPENQILNSHELIKKVFTNLIK